MSKDNKIVWEKWVDPFTLSEEEIDWNKPESEETDSQYIDEEYTQENFKKNQIYAIVSPMGIIPYNEYNDPGKIFNFWVGHTNFDITQEISNLIEKSAGVEILDVFTRYRFRIAIGKGFVDRDVMCGINSSIDNYFNHE